MNNDCLLPETIEALVEGRLPPEQMRTLMAHVGSCEICQGAVESAREARASRLMDWSLSPSVSVSSPPDRLPPGTRIDRYIVLRTLGEGGMGVVYAAHDPDLDRQVAIKLVRPMSRERKGADHARRQVLQEAQTMAKVSHPNVVAVYDVGMFGDDVFVAMELVKGMNLNHWAAAQPRGWFEIVSLYIAAGEGLEAAHHAGIVHRDFKPANVLVGDDGRVRVTDFGLARRGRLIKGESADSTSWVADQTNPAGTPRYMAPEQWRGGAVDARADQFGFCVALYETLYGAAPYGGETAAQRYANMVAGAIRLPPRQRRVPARLFRVLQRGLKPDPADRFSGMRPLLEALGRRRRRRRWIAAISVALIAAATVAVYVRSDESGADRCRQSVRLEGVWDRPAKERVRAAFLATGKSYAAERFERVAAALDTYAQRWATMARKACESTWVTREQSEIILARRMECLDARRQELKAIVGVFTKADAKMLDRAVKAANALSSLSRCKDVPALLRPRAPDPKIAGKVRSIASRLARVRVLRRTGQLRLASAQVEIAVADARRVGHQATLGEALLVASGIDHDLRGGRKGAARAQRRLFAAIAALDAGRDDELKARAWNSLAWLEGVALRQFKKGRRFVRMAKAAAARLGGHPELETQSLYIEAIITQMTGDLDRARELTGRALVLAERQGFKRALFGSLMNLAEIHLKSGQSAKAVPLLKRALEIVEHQYGPSHPDVSNVLNNLGYNLFRLGRYDEAEAQYRRALAVGERRLGREHVDLLLAVHNLGDVLHARGRHAKALALFRRSLSIGEKGLRPTDPLLAWPLSGVAKALLELGRAEQSLPLAERALRLRLSSPGDVHLPHSKLLVARLLWRTGGDRRRARMLATEARDALRKAGKPFADELRKAEAWLKAHP